MNAHKNKNLNQKIAFTILKLTAFVVVMILFTILGFISIKGVSVISWEFLTSFPKQAMSEGGILPAIVGTLLLTLGSIIIAFPLGVLSAIYLNEFAKKDSKIVKFIRMMINNLSGIPSIVFGIFGMTFFVNKLGFGDSILAGSLTLSLLVLPVIISTSEEALKQVDDSFRYASTALGANKITTIRKIILPMATGNILTGLILSIGRVSGETAPILFTCAAYFMDRLPSSLFDQCMTLPYHLYVVATTGTNVDAGQSMAYGTAFVLIFLVLLLNLCANAIRKHFHKKYFTNK